MRSAHQYALRVIYLAIRADDIERAVFKDLCTLYIVPLYILHILRVLFKNRREGDMTVFGFVEGKVVIERLGVERSVGFEQLLIDAAARVGGLQFRQGIRHHCNHFLRRIQIGVVALDHVGNVHPSEELVMRGGGSRQGEVQHLEHDILSGHMVYLALGESSQAGSLHRALPAVAGNGYLILLFGFGSHHLQTVGKRLTLILERTKRVCPGSAFRQEGDTAHYGNRFKAVVRRDDGLPGRSLNVRVDVVELQLRIGCTGRSERRERGVAQRCHIERHGVAALTDTDLARARHIESMVAGLDIERTAFAGDLHRAAVRKLESGSRIGGEGVGALTSDIQRLVVLVGVKPHGAYLPAPETSTVTLLNIRVIVLLRTETTVVPSPSTSPLLSSVTCMFATHSGYSTAWRAQAAPSSHALIRNIFFIVLVFLTGYRSCHRGGCRSRRQS